MALLLGFAGLVVARRGRRPEEPLEPEPTESDEAPPSEDAAPSAPRGEPAPLPSRKARGKICPTCGEQYPGEAEFCGKDATKLLPLNA
jgi:hypothetical protein